MFFIKLKVKGYLKNLTENTEELIDTFAIKNSNVISYILDNTKYKLIINKDKINLIRENDEISHSMIYQENKKNSSEYYLKQNSNFIVVDTLVSK